MISADEKSRRLLLRLLQPNRFTSRIIVTVDENKRSNKLKVKILNFFRDSKNLEH